MVKTISCLAFLIALLLFAAVGQALADDHREKGKHLKGGFRSAFQDLRTHGKGDHGNETTGQLTIWLLAAANLTVISSVLIKGANRILPLGEERKRWLSKTNQLQKKYLSKLHYFLNPAILGIALLHWSLSRCSSTTLPELGLIMMLIVAGFGVLLKFRLAPQKLTKTLYKIHTHPGVISSIALLLLVGHLAAD